MTPDELRARRKALGLTQSSLGAALGVAGNTVARWERGEVPIGNPELVRLAIERLERPVAADSASTQQGQPAPSCGETSRFVGRDLELRELGAMLVAAGAGAGGMAMLVGEPGIGKTSLARHFATLARHDGAAVLWGRCFEGPGSLPYAAWAEALASSAPLVGPDHPGAEFSPSATSPVAALVPDLRGLLPETLSAAPLSPDEERLRLYDAVTIRLRAISDEQPLVLVLDDLHWADRDALGLLTYLSHFVASMRLLLVGIYRDVELDRRHPLAAALDVLRHTADYRHFPVRGLSYPEIKRYLVRSSGGMVSEATARRIYELTGGSPLYARELLRHLVEEQTALKTGNQSATGVDLLEDGVPEGVRQVIRRRVARLGDPTQGLLDAAAGFGGPFTFAALRAVTGLAEDVVLDSVDEALRAGLLHAVSSPGEVYDFAHALVRRALYDELNASRKTRLHRRIAEALERLQPQLGVRDAAEIAAHYHASASLPGAQGGIPFALAAAEQARRSYAREQVVHFLRLARDLAEGADLQTHADVLCRLALAEAEATLLDEAARTTQVALDVLGEADAERDGIVAFLTAVARALKEAGASHLVWEPLVQRGLGLVGDRRDLQWARLVLLQDHFEVLSRGLINAARWTGHDTRALEIARSHGDQDDYAHSVEMMEWRSPAETEAVLQLARTWSRPTATLHALSVVAHDLSYKEDAFGQAADRYRELLAVSRRYGSLPSQVEALAQLSRSYRALGEFAEAEKALKQAREMAVRLGTDHRLHFATEVAMAAGAAYYRGGDWHSLVKSAMRFMASPRHARGPLGATAAAYTAMICVRAGRGVEARRILAVLVPVLERAQPRDYHHNVAAGAAALAIWELNAREFAPAARGLALRTLAAGVGAGPTAAHELTVARMAALLGHMPEAEEYFVQARERLLQRGQRPLLAIANHDEALVLLRGKSPDRARVTRLLEAALAEFEALNMQEWAQRTRALQADLLALRGTPPTGADGDLGVLSPREREVAMLIARGYTNRQIADALVITERTAETHLERIYAKLDFTSRAQLASWFTQRDANIVNFVRAAAEAPLT